MDSWWRLGNKSKLDDEMELVELGIDYYNDGNFIVMEKYYNYLKNGLEFYWEHFTELFHVDTEEKLKETFGESYIRDGIRYVWGNISDKKKHEVDFFGGNEKQYLEMLLNIENNYRKLLIDHNRKDRKILIDEIFELYVFVVALLTEDKDDEDDEDEDGEGRRARRLDFKVGDLYDKASGVEKIILANTTGLYGYNSYVYAAIKGFNLVGVPLATIPTKEYYPAFGLEDEHNIWIIDKQIIIHHNLSVFSTGAISDAYRLLMEKEDYEVSAKEMVIYFIYYFLTSWLTIDDIFENKIFGAIGRRRATSIEVQDKFKDKIIEIFEQNYGLDIKPERGIGMNGQNLARGYVYLLRNPPEIDYDIKTDKCRCAEEYYWTLSTTYGCYVLKEMLGKCKQD